LFISCRSIGASWVALVANLIGRELASVPHPACTPTRETNLHHRLADLLARYNVNDYAASVRVFAVKP
jgi:hypothetical protein